MTPHAVLNTIGFVIVMIASWILYRNAPEDVGIGRIPVRTGAIGEFHQKQQEAITSRATWSARGFFLLLVGSFLQFAGFIAQEFGH